MAENGSGGVGVLGVLVGALIVIIVGGGLLFATGNLENHDSEGRFAEGLDHQIIGV
jgi:Fe-S cluster assembly ATPase SufC